MNVENINFAQFLDYFTTWYPILVPSALLSIIILGCIIDRIRVVLVSYIDDYENDVKIWWWPKIKSLTGSDVYYGTKWMGSRYYYWVKVGRGFAGFSDKNKAKQYAKGNENIKPEIAEILMSHSIDTKVVFGPILPIIYLTGMLLVIKLLPWTVVVGIAIGYFTLKLTRSVVRLTKKFKSHVSDPNAHKGMNDED